MCGLGSGGVGLGSEGWGWGRRGEAGVGGVGRLSRAVDLAEEVERVDALVAQLGPQGAAVALLVGEQRHQVGYGLGTLELVHVLGVAHAEVLEAAQHLGV